MISGDIGSVNLSQRRLCEILTLNRNSYRNLMKSHNFCGPVLADGKQSRKECKQPRALSSEERDKVLATLTSEEYCNQPPAEVYYSLLEQNTYLCSISTMHRILRANKMQGERRKQRPPQSHMVPRLKATKPNEVWTWDIAKLATRRRGEYLSLYVVMDLFSRYIVSWMLSRKENSALSSQLIQAAVDRYGIEQNTLTLHQDRGAPMTAHCYLDLLSELAVTASHSRPRVSNDNAMSEAQFKTMKYQPDYPRRFDNYQHAEAWCRDYVAWYNYQHHHGSLAGFTPHQVFSGEHTTLLTKRIEVLNQAVRNHPERFAHGVPVVNRPADVVYINPAPPSEDGSEIENGVNFPTLQSRNAI